jgi:signal transduction histidine kinase/DNA-binding NarL/FixJ family response regulator
MLYLTPASVSYLNQFILAFVITAYLVWRFLIRKQGSPSAANRWLVFFFITVTILSLALFLEVSLLPTGRLLVVCTLNTILALLLVALIQFAYFFPQPSPRQKIERWLALAVSIAYLLFEVGVAIWRLWLLRLGNVQFRIHQWDYIPVAFFAWAIFVFGRGTVRNWRNPACRRFALILLIPLVLTLLNILLLYFKISTTFYQISLSLGVLLTLFLFAWNYMVSQLEATSLMVKISGAMLTGVLAVFGALAWLVTPAYVAQYRPPVIDHRSIQFAPNTSGGYDISEIPFHFESELGQNLELTDEPRGAPGTIEVAYDFPFYGQQYSRLFISNDGYVSFGALVDLWNLEYRLSNAPIFFALGMDLNPEWNPAGGVYLRQEADQLTITYDHIQAFYYPEREYTFQVALYRDGRINLTYNGLPTGPQYQADDRADASIWVIGAKQGWETDETFSFASLPLTTGPQGALDDQYRAFRQYLDTFLSPLAIAILVSSLLFMFGLPLMLNTAMARPLRALLAGVERFHQDQYEQQIPVRFNDEIGFLTASFNEMTSKIQGLMTTLEQRVAERTSELSKRTSDLAVTNERLLDEMKSRETAQAQMLTQQRTLASLEERERLGRQLHDGLGQVMGYINVQTQAAQSLLADGKLEAANQSLERVVQLAQEAHSDIRNFILGLRNTPQPEAGTLFAMLERYAQQFKEDTGIAVDLSFPAGDLPRLSPGVEEQVLHIIQEALVNIRKHANATRAEVWFGYDERAMQVVVSDNGGGFDVGKVLQDGAAHFGLGMMRERAEATGGRLEVRSAPGRGTKIVAYIPHFAEQAGGSGEGVQSILGMRILLVDDSPMFIEGLRNLLVARGLTVIGMARDGLEAQEMARALQPDVIVMDVMMPRCNGLEATRLIKAEFPQIKIVMLTVSEKDSHLFEAIQNGASGFLLKGMDANEFCTLLARLARGDAPLTPGAASRLMAEFARGQYTRSGDESLSERQWQILDLVARGLTYKEISLALHISEQLVKYHMNQIMKRLHLANRAEAIAYARRMQEKT